MKYLRKITFRFVSCVAPILFVSFSWAVSGQSVCDASYVRLNEVSGLIQATDDTGRGHLPGFHVKLWKIEKGDVDDKLIVSTKSSETGEFRILNIPRGNYRIEISDPKGTFIRIFANIKLQPRRVVSPGDNVALIKMGIAPLEPCGGGIVKAAKRGETTPRTL